MESVTVNLDDHNHQQGNHTPKIAIVDWDHVQVVRANQVSRSRFSRSCLGFSIHVLALFATMLFSGIMMAVTGFGQPAFAFWASLFAWSAGGLTPGPKYKKDGAALLASGQLSSDSAVPRSSVRS